MKLKRKKRERRHFPFLSGAPKLLEPALPAPYVRLFRRACEANFIFMDDDARPHRVQLMDEYLQLEDIQWLEWPAMFPDLNPIENAWDVLGRSFEASRAASVSSRVSCSILSAIATGVDKDHGKRYETP
ncbi:DDE_3 domain-containing protein [Trichonephila clavipes]|nr:DDE_3 domain-containing protein [Trichonephila clavipes]